MKKIIIFCPIHTVTGGPLLLHQMCYELRVIGYDAYMYYYRTNSADPVENPVADVYKKFGNPYVNCIEDRADNIFVLPEIYTFVLDTVKKAQCIFWWLSVDGYYNMMGNYISQNKNIDIKTLLKETLAYSKPLYNKNLVHFVQSQYALEHCRKIGIAEENIWYLSDYLDPVFIRNTFVNKIREKENMVLFNPQKGFAFTQLLMKAAPQFTWVALVNLSPTEMAELLQKAKIYIDFGEHPGKDRIPREAVISGCCILTGKKGSAGNIIDIPISDAYKFDDNESNLLPIIEKIQDIFDLYEERCKDFSSYKKIIMEEERLFKQQLRKIFKELVGIPVNKDKSAPSDILLKNAYEKLQNR